MGVKGFIRSVQAAQRRAEREAIRRQRELERRQREYAKMQEQAQAAYEVECYENKIDLLLSVHHTKKGKRCKRKTTNPSEIFSF